MKRKAIKESRLKIATAYVESGLSVIPIKTDGSKAPALAAWKPYQARRANAGELTDWFQTEPRGIAVVCGMASGNLEVIDVDASEIVAPLLTAIELHCPGLMARIAHVETPSGGAHLYYQCDTIAGNQKLARSSDKTTLIETRGEGGYVLAPGSPAACHPSGKLYVHRSGPTLPSVQRISVIERTAILDAARSLSQTFEIVATPIVTATDAGERPGDRFNRETEWEAVLLPHGWTNAGSVDGELRWRRPGKKDAWSASTGHCTNDHSGDLLYVFSSNATPFEPGHAYSKFAAYALLNHNGDFNAAARELAGEQGQRRTATVVVGLTADVELFHTSDREAYASYPVDRHVETAAIRSKTFRHWISHRYYQQQGRTANYQAMSEALDAIEGKALFAGQQSAVHTRIAAFADKIYLDLANEDWSVVEICDEGWQLVETSPVKFRRMRGMQPLPTPQRGGRIQELRDFLNIRDNEWRLVVAWLVAALRPDGPFPLLCLHGEQGSAKSTTARLLRSLIDPNDAPLRSEPREQRDLVISSANQ